MIFSFLIGTLVFFAIGLIVNLILVGVGLSQKIFPLVSIVTVIINLFMITWNILALISL